MNLQINDPTATRLIKRLELEIGQTYVANCFMDELNKDLNEKIAFLELTIKELQNTVISLNEKLVTAKNDNSILKDQIDIKRKGRFNGPHFDKRSESITISDDNPQPN